MRMCGACMGAERGGKKQIEEYEEQELFFRKIEIYKCTFPCHHVWTVSSSKASRQLSKSNGMN